MRRSAQNLYQRVADRKISPRQMAKSHDQLLTYIVRHVGIFGKHLPALDTIRLEVRELDETFTIDLTKDTNGSGESGS